MRKIYTSILKYRLIYFWIILVIVATQYASFSQTSRTLEMFVTGSPSGNGPSVANLSVILQENTNNPTANTFTASASPVTVTYSISNQQFAGFEGNTTTRPFQIGADLNSAANSPLVADLLLSTQGYFGGSANANYTSCPTCVAGTGIDITSNYALNMLTVSDALLNASGANNVAVNTRNRYADITITFSRPVSNPILHLTGLGGFVSKQVGTKFYDLGTSTEFDLLGGTYTLTKLSGNSALTVSSTSITNGAASFGTSTAGSVTRTVTRTAASGSVMINGTNITSVTFAVYLKGDGGSIRTSTGTVTTADAGQAVTWGNTNGIGGDGFLMSVSTPQVAVTGTVFEDNNALTDNTVNGIPTNKALNSEVYAYLVNSAGTVVDSSEVLANGTYALYATSTETFTVRISTNQVGIGATAPLPNLPTNWIATGDNLGSGTGSDGTPDLSLSVTTTAANFNTGTGITNANFGFKDGLDTDGDLVADAKDLDDDNDGILDIAERNCGFNQTWTSLGGGVWQANLTSTLKVKVTFGNYAAAWSNDVAITNFNRACLESTYTSNFSPIVNTNKPALQFLKTTATAIGTVTVEYLDNNNLPVNILNPRFHLGGIGGSYGAGAGLIGASDWALQGGKTMTTLSRDVADFGTTSTTIFHPRLGQTGSGVADCSSGEGSGTIQINGSHSSYTFNVKINGGAGDGMVLAFEACGEPDTDADGIANYLDLDSDGDGCADAVEGGANFSVTNLVASTMAGGNSGGTYNGTSTTPVSLNLGNTVGSTTTTLGVPTLAGTGQTVGSSADKLVQDANCPPVCVAGTIAPIITATTVTNTCPATTFSLASLANTGTKPAGTTLIWSTNKVPTSVGDTLTNLTTVSTAGKYYALYFDKVSNCYSPADSVTATITTCCLAGTTAPTLSATTQTNVCPATSANISTLVSSACPVGSALEWHSTNTGLSAANKVANPASVGAGTYYPVCFDATNACYSPTPTTGVTVTITVCCQSGTIAPIITATTVTNTCPATTFSLASLANTGTKPAGTTLIWSTNKVPTSVGDTLTNLTTVSTAGKYYALYFDKVSNCYSPADSVTATITTCLAINQPASQTGVINTPKSGTVSTDVTPTGGTGAITYTNASTDPLCVAPLGATALPTASNLTISSTGAYSYTVPAIVGTYYFCVKVCDSTTPTPDCKIATYQVTATAVPCLAGTTAPTLSATTKSNVCPATTADISLLVSSTCPVGSILEWHNTNTGLSAANKVANPASVPAGIYYPVCFDALNACYSPTPNTGVTVTITACCQSGTVAPIITATTVTNICPTTTFSLAALANIGIKPAGTSLIWSTNKVPTSAGDTLTNLTAVSTAGKYYALYFDKVNNCYSPADSVTATLTICAINPAGQTAITNQAKTGNAGTELTPTGGTGAYMYSADNTGACTPVVGATALSLSSNFTVTNSATGAYSYTAPATAGTYYYCIKVCDSATPTASCVTKTYTLTVSTPACAVGTVIPGIK